LTRAGSTYALQVVVRVSTGSAPVQLTIHSSLRGQADVYTPVATGVAETDCWTQLNGTFTLTSTADSVIMYVEGASAGVDVSVMIAAAVPTVPALTIRPRPSDVVGYQIWLTETWSLLEVFKISGPAVKVILDTVVGHWNGRLLF
jgi:hypothetical protein